jgi:molybdopterin converting factor subunit 1
LIVRALFFAQYRDFAGADEISVELPAGATALDLVAWVRGSAARIPDRPVVAVNLEYAPLATPLRDGDEVAFIPPVAGG